MLYGHLQVEAARIMLSFFFLLIKSAHCNKVL